MAILLMNGRLINPADQLDGLFDILIEDGIVKERLPHTDEVLSLMEKKYDSLRTYDLTGRIIFPGFIDLHVHFRDPGQTEKETIETGIKAAAHGGFTTVLTMPNTSPVCDNPSIVEYVHKKARNCHSTEVLQIGSITKGMEGKELNDIAALKEAGVPAISEDGKSVMNSALARRAFKIAKENDLPVFSHCEDIDLVEGGVMNQGKMSLKYDLPGISNSVENIIIARNIFLAEETGATLHLCHNSTKESYLCVKLAKEHGIHVTGEVTPHHFVLCEDEIDPNNANYKMNPPVRTAEDREYLIRGLKENVFDVIATDHAPHTASEKARGFKSAPFGIVGLETAAALTYTYLVKPGHLSLMQMAEKMSYNPARIIKKDYGDISVGKKADLTIFDATKKYKIDSNEFYSKGHNEPFDGREVYGKVVATIKDGDFVFKVEGEKL
ncbi:MAG: dihydroorotase [Lachnospiraceae bacterium]|nr:dihydroorotase [Lachnospiraceae bacterium]